MTAGGDERFVEGPVPRVRSLSREEFVLHYRGRSPVVVEGGALETRAYRRWDPDYLVERCGETPLELLSHVYEAGAIAREYARAASRRTSFGELVRDVEAGRPGTGYLFNTEQAVFRVNDSDPDLRVGRGARANPGLAILGEDFEVPGFMCAADLIYCMLVLGSSRDKSPLHYDLSGEVKTVVQIRGRKRVLLFPPDQVRRLYVASWFEPPLNDFDLPYISRAELRAPDLERFPELARARCLEAVLEPGDVLYWPSFWFHDVTNLDDPTLAVTVAYEELRASSMHLREHLAFLSRLLLRRLRARGSEPSEELREAFLEMETVLLSDEMLAKTSLWSWCHEANRPDA